MIHPVGMGSLRTSPEAAASPSSSKPSLLLRALQAGKNRLWYRRELRVYRYPLEEAPSLPVPAIFRRNCLDDLQYYERWSKEQHPPDAYRAMAAERRAQGFHLYSYVEGGRLLHYGWLIDARHAVKMVGWIKSIFLLRTRPSYLITSPTLSREAADSTFRPFAGSCTMHESWHELARPLSPSSARMALPAM